MSTFTDCDGDTMEVTTHDTFVAFDAIDSMDGERATLHLDRRNVTALCDQLNAWLTATDLPDATADGYDWPEAEDKGDPRADESTVATEAHGLVYGDRQGDYGHPREDFTRTAIVWTGLLHHKLADGQFIDAEDIARCMVGVKLSRDVHSPKRDNRVDGIGYFITLDRLETGK